MGFIRQIFRTWHHRKTSEAVKGVRGELLIYVDALTLEVTNYGNPGVSFYGIGIVRQPHAAGPSFRKRSIEHCREDFAF